MSEDPNAERDPGTIDPPNLEEEAGSSLSSADDASLDPGTIDPPN